jgi:beta-1,4-mannosyltransferase
MIECQRMCARQRIQVCVVVLGDVGRSPRMQYHALALASALAEVDVVGYAGSTLAPAVRDHGHIRWHFLPPDDQRARHGATGGRFLARAAVKMLRDCLGLLRLLLRVVRKPNVILVQNPPAIPTLVIALAAARLRGARLVVDWHNLGYTMLGLRLGERHPLVRLARRYEGFLGRRADRHLCVSRHLQAVLAEDWRILGAVVLYDRPAAVFARTPEPMRESLLRRLGNAIGLPVDDDLRAGRGRSSRPALLVSPTSWTADEDFAVLVDALRQCDERIQAHRDAAGCDAFPPLWVVITGQGPLRDHWEAQIAELELRAVVLRTAWLAAEDYPLFLGAADLGLCLHRSSSGLDLPMKVADMFGAGLPVCALDYGPCLAEQVQHGGNGLLFRTSAQLAEQLFTLFRGFPDDSLLLDDLRRNVVGGAGRRWAEEWNIVARPVFET